MAQGLRPDRIAEEIRHVLSETIAQGLRDPGIGFITLTRVKVSPDLQLARVHYTLIGDDKARSATKKALDRATPFLRHQIASHIRMRRVPELRFHFDEGVAHQDRIEKILLDLQAERDARAAEEASAAGAKTEAPGAEREAPASAEGVGAAGPDTSHEHPPSPEASAQRAEAQSTKHEAPGTSDEALE